MPTATRTAVRAITIREPWASLIAAGRKTIENRSAGTTHRGTLYIHASRTIDTPALTDPRVTRTIGDPTETAHRTAGTILAVADLTDVHTAQDVPTLLGEPGTCCTPWGERRHSGRPARHLVLDNIRLLPEPFEAAGALGLWTPADWLVEQVTEQLAKAGIRP